MKKHNFNPGPSVIAPPVIEKSIQAIKDYKATGLSILEISHRSFEFSEILETAQNLALQLLGLSAKKYSILFLQGGASMQFLMVAYNFLKNKSGYINTGAWSEKAIKEAQKVGQVIEIDSSKDKNFSYIPKDYTIPQDLDYLHITTNNTIFGTQYKKLPNSPVPLVADMSSDIFSKEMNYSKMSLFYAGAQKNLGISGVTIVVLENVFWEKIQADLPSILSYKEHIYKKSLLNTPPVFAIYTLLLTLEWLQSQGGLKNVGKTNEKKARLLYEEIDNNPLFKGISKKEDRSQMNVTFDLTEEKHKEKFENLCIENYIHGIKGHRSVGGYRASIYNALSLKSVEILVACMKVLKKSV